MANVVIPTADSGSGPGWLCQVGLGGAGRIGRRAPGGDHRLARCRPLRDLCGASPTAGQRTRPITPWSPCSWRWAPPPRRSGRAVAAGSHQAGRRAGRLEAAYGRDTLIAGLNRAADVLRILAAHRPVPGESCWFPCPSCPPGRCRPTPWTDTETPVRNDGATMTCGHCGAAFAPTGRRRWCSDACRQAAFRPGGLPSSCPTHQGRHRLRVSLLRGPLPG